MRAVVGLAVALLLVIAAVTPAVAERYAVVIGVGYYSDPQIPALPFAAKDALAVYEFLVTTGGYSRDNVLLLTDTTAQKPTLGNIKRAIGEWLYRRAGKDDVTLVFFAGHGAAELDVSGWRVTHVLLPRDIDPNSLFVTGLRMDDLATIATRVPGYVLFVVDAGFAATGIGRSFRPSWWPAGRSPGTVLRSLTRNAILVAAEPPQSALELADVQHGLLTYYVLKALRGDADADRDGIVTVGELFEFVGRTVPEHARRLGSEQMPAISRDRVDQPLVQIRK